MVLRYTSTFMNENVCRPFLQNHFDVQSKLNSFIEAKHKCCMCNMSMLLCWLLMIRHNTCIQNIAFKLAACCMCSSYNFNLFSSVYMYSVYNIVCRKGTMEKCNSQKCFEWGYISWNWAADPWRRCDPVPQEWQREAKSHKWR